MIKKRMVKTLIGILSLGCLLHSAAYANPSELDTPTTKPAPTVTQDHQVHAQPLPTVKETTQTINLNTADTYTLANLIDGIGSKRAASIVAYRNEHGPFKSIDDLANVKGISTQFIEKNRAYLENILILG
jgi:competence ComEA-like helix-hairpin-helix protein